MLYSNSQWCVDNDGIDTLDGSYFIEKARLTEKSRGRYDWPEQVGLKSWCDAKAFLLAYAFALELFHPHYDKLMLAECIQRLYERKAKSVRFDIISERMFPTPDNGLRWLTMDVLSAVNTALVDEDAKLAKRSANDNKQDTHADAA